MERFVDRFEKIQAEYTDKIKAVRAERIQSIKALMAEYGILDTAVIRKEDNVEGMLEFNPQAGYIEFHHFTKRGIPSSKTDGYVFSGTVKDVFDSYEIKDKEKEYDEEEPSFER